MKKNYALKLLAVLACLIPVTGCSLQLGNVEIADNQLSEIGLSGKELDLAILKHIYPAGFVNTLDNVRESFVPASRNAFSPNDFHEYSEETPDEIYGNSSGEIRVPASGSLTPADGDWTKGRRYFFMVKTDLPAPDGNPVTRHVYKIRFIIEPLDTSSVEMEETVYYVAGDSWSPRAETSLTLYGWESETTSYKNGRVGQRELIATWFGDEAKSLFIGPDYSPFSDEETPLGTSAVFTIDIDQLYGNGTHNLNYYFNKFWQDIPEWSDLEGVYSSFSRKLIYNDAADVGKPGNALSEQNTYYSEVNNISEFPLVLGREAGERGSIHTDITYSMRPINQASVGTARTAGTVKPLNIVAVCSKYFDEEGNFLMKDAKTLNNAPESTYKHVYSHTTSLTENSVMKYTEVHNYYREGNITELRAAGEDSHDKQVSIEMSCRTGGSPGWAGIISITTEETEDPVWFSVDLHYGFPAYTATFNGEEFSIVPDMYGNIHTMLPGGGFITGSVDDEGVLRAKYTAPDETLTDINGGTD